MMPSCLSILFRALRIEWRETKRTLLPTTPIETGLFLSSSFFTGVSVTGCSFIRN